MILTKFNLCHNYLQTRIYAYRFRTDNLLGCLGMSTKKFEEHKHVPKVAQFTLTERLVPNYIRNHVITPVITYTNYKHYNDWFLVVSNYAITQFISRRLSTI